VRLAWGVWAGACCALAAADEPSGTAHPDLWPAAAHGVLVRPDVERFVDELLAKLTVEEKVGQLIQADINWITPDDLVTYKLGSVQAGGNSAPGNDVRATPQAWLETTEAFYQASMRTGDQRHPPIPILFAIDAVHGHARIRGATIFPHNIGLGAAHDAALIRRIGEATAEEVVTTGIDWSFAPTLAVVRDVRWGRTYESYSEEPGLVRDYAAAMIDGLQGRVGTSEFLDSKHTIATAKHFLGDGGTLDGRDQGDNLASEQDLVRVHGAGYVAAIKAGAATIMASYNGWHGVKMHGNHSLLTDVLKGRLGFDGFIVGDWNGQEEIAGCTKFNCPGVIVAGIDMVMGPDGWKDLYRNTLAQARSGVIPADRLNDAVRRILRVKALANLFNRPSPVGRPDSGRFERLGSAPHRAIARQAVRESLVLLKNEHGLLPLDPHATYLVAGDGADNLSKQAGGWTVDWQGDRNTAADFPGGTSIYAGLKAAIEQAGGTITLSTDGRYSRRPDAAIIVIGENPYAEFEGDRENLSFSQYDGRGLAVLRRLRAAGVPIVTVLLSGRPLWVNPELNASDAFVAAWLPGTEGNGIADLLLRAPDGSVPHDFTGKLSFSWPKTAMPVSLGAADQPIDPLFARGFGLTYGDDAQLPVLSEDPQIPMQFAGHDTLFFAGHVTAPWSIYVDDKTAGVRLTTQQQASPDGTVTVALQTRAVTVSWHGGASGTLRVSGRAIDLRRAAADGEFLSFRYRVIHRPSAAVAVSIDCGHPCHGAVDITSRLASSSGPWQMLRIPLQCFIPKDGSLATVDTPFAITTNGSLTMRITDVRFEQRAASTRKGCLHSD